MKKLVAILVLAMFLLSAIPIAIAQEDVDTETNVGNFTANWGAWVDMILTIDTTTFDLDKYLWPSTEWGIHSVKLNVAWTSIEHWFKDDSIRGWKSIPLKPGYRGISNVYSCILEIESAVEEYNPSPYGPLVKKRSDGYYFYEVFVKEGNVMMPTPWYITRGGVIWNREVGRRDVPHLQKEECWHISVELGDPPTISHTPVTSVICEDDRTYFNITARVTSGSSSWLRCPYVVYCYGESDYLYTKGLDLVLGTSRIRKEPFELYGKKLLMEGIFSGKIGASLDDKKIYYYISIEDEAGNFVTLPPGLPNAGPGRFREPIPKTRRQKVYDDTMKSESFVINLVTEEEEKPPH